MTTGIDTPDLTHTNIKEVDSKERVHPAPALIVPFLVIFVLLAFGFQITSDVPPWIDGSPIEYFSGSVLWMSSIFSLLIADRYWPIKWGSLFKVFSSKNLRQIIEIWKPIFWIGLSAGFLLLAIDEIFMLREQSTQAIGIGDDHIQVLQVIIAMVGVYIIYYVEQLPRYAWLPFLFGAIFHLLYIFLEIGDGSYFNVIPLLGLQNMRWAEEFLELFALLFYTIGILYTFSFVSQRKQTIQTDR